MNNGQVSSVRFANSALDNIGASLSFASDEQSEDYDDRDSYYGSDQVETTLEEFVNNPLAMGMAADIRQMKRAAQNNVADESNIHTDV